MLNAHLRSVLLFGLALCAATASAQSQLMWKAERDRLWSVDADSNYAHARVSTIVIGADHLVRVVDSERRSIVVFDSLGRFRYRFGRSGDKRGEFADIRTAGFLADTFWVSEGSRRRVTFFLDSAPVGTHAIDYNPGRSPFSSAAPRGMLSDGSALVQLHVSSQEEGARPGLDVPVVSVARKSTLLASLLTLEYGHPGTAYQGGVLVYAPFNDAGIWRAAPDGSGAAFVNRPVSKSSSNSTYRVRRIDGRGRITFDRTYNYRPVPISKVSADSVRTVAATTVAKARRLTQKDALALVGPAVYVPDYLPPVRSVLAASDGSTWVELNDKVAASHWLVLDDRGDPIGQIALPRSLSVLHVSRQHIWGTEKNSAGRSSVVRYRVRQ